MPKNKITSSGRTRSTPWSKFKDVPLWARDRRRALDFPGKWLLYGGVRPRDMSFSYLAPDLPDSHEVQEFLRNCSDVLAVFPSWKASFNRKNTQPVERVFEERLPETLEWLSEASMELEGYSYRDRLGILSDVELSRFSDLLLEAVLVAGRCRAFVERVCGGDFALFLYRNGWLTEQAMDLRAREDSLKPGGVDPVKKTAEYRNFVERFDENDK